MNDSPTPNPTRDEPIPALSRAGEHRRAAMLDELLGELESTRRGRATRKRLATVAGFGMLVTGAVVIALTQSRPGAPAGGAGSAGTPIARDTVNEAGKATTPSQPTAAAEILHGTRIVRTDPSIVNRWRAAAPSSGAVIASSAAASSSLPTIRIITTAGTSLADFAPDPAAMARVTIRSLSDEELINALAAIGRPAGIIRMGGKVWLSAAVTDEEIEKERERSKG